MKVIVAVLALLAAALVGYLAWRKFKGETAGSIDYNLLLAQEEGEELDEDFFRRLAEDPNVREDPKVKEIVNSGQANPEFIEALKEVAKEQGTYLDTQWQEVPMTGTGDSWYERRSVKETTGWSADEYQERWEAVIGAKLGGTGVGKVAYPAEAKETGLPLMSAEEFIAFGYGEPTSEHKWESDAAKAAYYGTSGTKTGTGKSTSTSEAKRYEDSEEAFDKAVKEAAETGRVVSWSADGGYSTVSKETAYSYDYWY